MIVTLDNRADPDAVRRALVGRGLWVRRYEDALGTGRTQFVIDSRSPLVPAAELLSIEGVGSVATSASERPLLERQSDVVEIGGVPVGVGAAPVLMAGPCSVESPEQIRGLAARLKPLGVRFLRGGAFKPRTSPYAFQGHGSPALRWLREAADEHGLLVVTEIPSVAETGQVAEVADLLQIGSRSMHNSRLLRAAGATGKPVLLKRGMAATIEEWLSAAEYCLVSGAPAVVFCERGIRSFDPNTRNLLDLGAVALLAHVFRLPVIVDPSHGAGRRDLITPLSRAALAAGAAGLMLETHEEPGEALSDGPQAISPLEVGSIARHLQR